jgi:hypothetical protein
MLQVLRHDLMKLPSRAATHAEANAVTAEIAALQTEVERADTMTEVSGGRRSLADHWESGATVNGDLCKVPY